MASLRLINCTTCGAKTRPAVVLTVSPDHMRTLAQAGFGEVVPILAEHPLEQRREIFQRFADSYETRWAICPNCAERAANYDDRRIAAQPPATTTVSFVSRAALGVLAIFFVLIAYSVLSSFPEHSPVPGRPNLRAHSAAFAGLARATAIVALLAGLMLLNAAARLKSGNGPIDGILDKLGGSGFPLLGYTPTNCIIVAAIAGIWLAIELVFHTAMYWDPESAAAAFVATRNSLDVAITGDFAFVRDTEGMRHLAVLTPEFVRAAEAHGIRFGAVIRPSEFPLPGFLPIITMAVFGAIQATRLWQGLLGHRLSIEPKRIAAQSALGFGIVSMYIVIWIGSVQTGILVSPSGDYVEGNLVFLVGVLILAGVVVHAVLWQWITRSPGRLLFAYMGWVNIYFIGMIAAVLATYNVGWSSPGTPGRLWMLAYVLAATACWLGAMPVDRAQRAEVDREILERAK